MTRINRCLLWPQVTLWYNSIFVSLVLIIIDVVVIHHTHDAVLSKVYALHDVLFHVDDGALRIWKDFNSKSQNLRLVTSWHAIHEPPVFRTG